VKSRSRRAFYPTRTALSDEIPAQWHALPLKRLFRVVGGSTPPSNSENWDGDIAWVTPGDLSGLNGFSISSGKRSITEQGVQSCGTSLVPRGSIIVSTRAPIGSLAVAEREMCTNQGCKALVPDRRVNSRFFAYALSISSSQLNALGQGSTFKEISGDTLGAFSLPVPPFEEQCRIAAFLDYETARIDELVHEQERLQRLIEEWRHSIIVQSVLGGLRENVPLRDSGFESLGHIPAHWTVKPTKYLGHLVTGTTPRRLADADGVVEGLPWVRPDDFDEWSGAVTPRTFLPSLLASEVRSVPKGSLLVSCIGRIGTTVQAGDELATNQQITAIVPRNVHPRYLFYALRSLRQELERNAVGNVIPILNASRLSRIVVPFPPREEQRQIAVFLDGEVERLNALFHHQEKSILLLRERRSALIGAAVTGQLDLRDWQPPDSRVMAEVV